MKIIGLTGGIGSGKTTVAGFFKELGVPVYIADDEAKMLMNSSPYIQQKIIALFGEEAYANGKLNNALLASQVFKNPLLLKKLNEIVHPEVGRHFKEWAAQQNAPYVIKEAAILFENGSYKNCDAVILVKASKENKIQRILKRDQTSITAIEERMNNQWLDEEKEKLADFIIQNNDLPATKIQVLKLHELLKK